jgi:hypothetical protein
MPPLPSPAGACGTPQKTVNQQPVFDRRLRVHRPRKKKGRGSQPKFV